MSGIFDPSEQETKELLPKNKSDMSDYTEDTIADAEGVLARQTRADIVLPDWYFRKFALTDLGINQLLIQLLWLPLWLCLTLSSVLTLFSRILNLVIRRF